MHHVISLYFSVFLFYISFILCMVMLFWRALHIDTARAYGHMRWLSTFALTEFTEQHVTQSWPTSGKLLRHALCAPFLFHRATLHSDKAEAAAPENLVSNDSNNWSVCESMSTHPAELRQGRAWAGCVITEVTASILAIEDIFVSLTDVQAATVFSQGNYRWLYQHFLKAKIKLELNLTLFRMYREWIL